MWEDEFDDILLGGLIQAYIKRQKWLAKLQAIEVANVLLGTSENKAQKISSEEMFNLLT